MRRRGISQSEEKELSGAPAGRMAAGAHLLSMDVFAASGEWKVAVLSDMMYVLVSRARMRMPEELVREPGLRLLVCHES